MTLFVVTDVCSYVIEIDVTVWLNLLC